MFLPIMFVARSLSNLCATKLNTSKDPDKEEHALGPEGDGGGTEIRE